MSNTEEIQKIEKLLYTHGKLSILIYKSNDLFIVQKIGEYDSLAIFYERAVERFEKAGFEKEASSTTIMELPRDVEEIFKIIHCNGLEKFLIKNNITI